MHEVDDPNSGDKRDKIKDPEQSVGGLLKGLVTRKEIAVLSGSVVTGFIEEAFQRNVITGDEQKDLMEAYKITMMHGANNQKVA